MVAPVSANIIYEKVSSTTRQIVWFTKSGHEMMQDMEADKVCESLMEFINEFRKSVKAKPAPLPKLADAID